LIADARADMRPNYLHQFETVVRAHEAHRARGIAPTRPRSSARRRRPSHGRAAVGVSDVVVVRPLFVVTTFGESHGPAVGVVVDGMPPGIAVDPAVIQRELDRRRPGQSALTTQRSEADQVELLSGVFEGVSLGTPIANAGAQHGRARQGLRGAQGRLPARPRRLQHVS